MKTNLGRKGLFGFQFIIRHAVVPRQELKVETLGELCLLACSLWLLSLLSCIIQDHLPAQG